MNLTKKLLLWCCCLVIVMGEWVIALQSGAGCCTSIITNTRITNNFSKAFEWGSGEVHSEPRPSTEQQGGLFWPHVGSEIRRTRGVAKLARGVQPPSTRTLVPDGEKVWWHVYLFRHNTDRQTDRHLATAQSTLFIELRGRNMQKYTHWMDCAMWMPHIGQCDCKFNINNMPHYVVWTKCIGDDTIRPARRQVLPPSEWLKFHRRQTNEHTNWQTERDKDIAIA